MEPDLKDSSGGLGAISGLEGHHVSPRAAMVRKSMMPLRDTKDSEGSHDKNHHGRSVMHQGTTSTGQQDNPFAALDSLISGGLQKERRRSSASTKEDPTSTLQKVLPMGLQQNRPRPSALTHILPDGPGVGHESGDLDDKGLEKSLTLGMRSRWSIRQQA